MQCTVQITGSMLRQWQMWPVPLRTAASASDRRSECSHRLGVGERVRTEHLGVQECRRPARRGWSGDSSAASPRVVVRTVKTMARTPHPEADSSARQRSDGRYDSGLGLPLAPRLGRRPGVRWRSGQPLHARPSGAPHPPGCPSPGRSLRGASLALPCLRRSLGNGSASRDLWTTGELPGAHDRVQGKSKWATDPCDTTGEPLRPANFQALDVIGQGVVGVVIGNRESSVIGPPRRTPG